MKRGGTNITSLLFLGAGGMSMKYVLVAVVTFTAAGLGLLYGLQYYHTKNKAVVRDEVRVQNLQSKLFDAGLKTLDVATSDFVVRAAMKNKIKENKEKSKSANKEFYTQKGLKPQMPSSIDLNDLRTEIHNSFVQDETEVAEDVAQQKRMVQTVRSGGLKVSR